MSSEMLLKRWWGGKEGGRASDHLKRGICLHQPSSQKGSGYQLREKSQEILEPHSKSCRLSVRISLCSHVCPSLGKHPCFSVSAFLCQVHRVPGGFPHLALTVQPAPLQQLPAHTAACRGSLSPVCLFVPHCPGDCGSP